MAVLYVYARDRCVCRVETRTLFQVSELDAQLVFLSLFSNSRTVFVARVGFFFSSHDI